MINHWWLLMIKKSMIDDCLSIIDNDQWSIMDPWFFYYQWSMIDDVIINDWW